MKTIFKNIINEVIKWKLKKKNLPLNRLEKEVMYTKVEFNHLIRDSFFILFGIISATFGLKGFLLPNAFIDGGVTGISLIITELTKIPLSVLLVVINLPFMIMAFS
ncbi:YitT family protein, partial [Lutibacter sp.]